MSIARCDLTKLDAYKNTHTLEIIHTLLSFAVGQMDHSRYDCFVLALLSRGYSFGGDDYVFGVDGKRISIRTMMEPIKKCRTLAGKPKICIVQVSRFNLKF